MMWVFSVWMVRWSVFWKVGRKLDQMFEWVLELAVQLSLTGGWNHKHSNIRCEKVKT